MIKGLNHITIAVSNLDKSVNFYRDVLGFEAHVVWAEGAYLSAGDLWFCLSVDAPCEKTDYTHFAFTVGPEEFESFCEHLKNNGVVQWRKNSSEGDSMYFLDPDGHKLEIHVGSLHSRLKSLHEKPYSGTQWQR